MHFLFELQLTEWFIGEPTIMQNIRLLSHIVNIENVEVPKTMPYLKTLVRSMAPEVEIDTYDENELFEIACFRVQRQDWSSNHPLEQRLSPSVVTVLAPNRPLIIVRSIVQNSMNLSLLHLTILPILFRSILSFINQKILKNFCLPW